LSTNNSVDVSLAGQTGTVAFVGSTSPTLVTPLLGTPTSGNLSNCTAYPVASLSGLGSGVATALAATANGSGAIALTTGPTLVTPSLGVATATSINFGGSALSTYATGGTWTPTFSFATPGDLSVSYVSQAGNYTRIGNIVVVSFVLQCTPTFTTSSGVFMLGGLPFATNSATGNNSTAPVYGSSVTAPAGTINFFALTTAGVTNIQFVGITISGSVSNLSTTGFVTGQQILITLSMTYLA